MLKRLHPNNSWSSFGFNTKIDYGWPLSWLNEIIVLCLQARPLLRDRKNIYHMVDPELRGQYPPKQLYKAFATALICVQEQPSTRPRVSEVAKALDHIVSQLYTPQSPPAQTTPEIPVIS